MLRIAFLVDSKIDSSRQVHRFCLPPLPTPHSPPLSLEGGSVEIGKSMAVNTDGSITSAQMKQFSKDVAKMEGLVTELQDGLAAATANIAVLTKDSVALKTDSAALKADNVALKANSAALKADNADLKGRVLDLETAAAAAASTGGSSGASSDELAAVKADLTGLAANYTKDMSELSDGFSKEIVQFGDRLAEVNATLTTTMSNVVYADGVHPGGDLDFTEGSASLAILKQTLPGVKVFLSGTTIKGTNVKGSVVSELLKDVTAVGGTGTLNCNNNQAYFAADDDGLVFASLETVHRINILGNGNIPNSAGLYSGPTSVSFPALKYVQYTLRLYTNKRLKTISMPALVGVAGDADFYGNSVLASLQLPSLLYVGVNFYLYENPQLPTGGIKVSSQFESVGNKFQAWKSGFTCTAGNGLTAVVNGAKDTTNVGGHSNPTSCQK